ncbi:hypothetical protein ABXJ76_03870 [Methylobacter sp. G7]|uniref:hypothetical protein n=1 Tax=Methylobacter sp. G7 TaxID=3230117 RepID=UPI003D80773A
MNTIPGQEIKRRGTAAVDDLLAKGDVHVIRNNQPQYAVLAEARHQALLEAEDEAYTARVLASLEDLHTGRIQRGTAAELLKELDVHVHPRLDLRLYPYGREIYQAAPGNLLRFSVIWSAIHFSRTSGAISLAAN